MATMVIIPLELAPQFLWCTRKEENAVISYCFKEKIECTLFYLDSTDIKNQAKDICVPTKV